MILCNRHYVNEVKLTQNVNSLRYHQQQKKMCFHFHIWRCLMRCHSSPNFFLPARAASLVPEKFSHIWVSSCPGCPSRNPSHCCPLPALWLCSKILVPCQYISIKLERERREGKKRKERKRNPGRWKLTLMTQGKTLSFPLWFSTISINCNDLLISPSFPAWCTL